MKFSIITCTLNSAVFLQQSIDSVISQTHADIEYIFVDGGSTDGTLEIISNIKFPKIVVQGIGGGIAAAMNHGIKLASGEVIVHLHSDDYFAHAGVLERVDVLMSGTAYQWLFGRCLSDSNGVITSEPYAVPKYTYKRLLKGNFIPHPATFVRKSLFEQIGVFDVGIKYAMDYDLWLRLGGVSCPMQVDEHLSVFRRHSGSFSTANRLAAFEDDYAVRVKYTDGSLYSRLYHFVHFLVRRRRIFKSIS